MSEKRFTLDDEENGLCRCILVDGEEMPTCEICNLLNEQQATIRKLQDLCGESDTENAKLRIENKKLKEENEQLRSELKKLKKKEKSWKKIHCCNKESSNCGIVIEQQAEIKRLQKIIDLTQYQLKVQDRILKEVGE